MGLRILAAQQPGQVSMVPGSSRRQPSRGAARPVRRWRSAPVLAAARSPQTRIIRRRIRVVGAVRCLGVTLATRSRSATNVRRCLARLNRLMGGCRLVERLPLDRPDGAFWIRPGVNRPGESGGEGSVGGSSLGRGLVRQQLDLGTWGIGHSAVGPRALVPSARGAATLAAGDSVEKGAVTHVAPQGRLSVAGAEAGHHCR